MKGSSKLGSLHCFSCLQRHLIDGISCTFAADNFDQLFWEVSTHFDPIPGD